MHSKLEDRDLVLLVAVVLILVAIVLVCCKQSVPAALLVVFVMALLALSVDFKTKILLPVTTTPSAPAAASLPTASQAAPVAASQVPPQAAPVAASQVPPEAAPMRGNLTGTYFRPLMEENQASRGAPAVRLQTTAASAVQEAPRVEIENVQTTNVPVFQNNPPVAPKVCSINSAYTQFNPPELNSLQSNTYPNLYVLPTEVSRPPGQSVAQVQAKTDFQCIKKEIGAFPKPDRMKGTDVFMGDDAVFEIELERLKQQEATKSLIMPPAGSTTLDAALDVSPKPFPEYYYVKPLPDHDKQMKQKIRNEGLYGVNGDLNCLHMRRSAVANTGFIQPIEGRQEFLRYLAYDMPNYRNQWQTARFNTVNSDTRYFK